MIESDNSCNSADGIAEVLKKIFKDRVLNFSIGRTKFTYLLKEALGPYFQKIILEEIGNSYYVDKI